jgi:hypothetical protein
MIVKRSTRVRSGRTLGFTDFQVPGFRAGILGKGTGDWKVAFTRRQECRRYARVLVGRVYWRITAR